MGYTDKLGQVSYRGVLPLAREERAKATPCVGHRLAIIPGQPAAQLTTARTAPIGVWQMPSLLYYRARHKDLNPRAGIERLGPSLQSSGVASESKPSPTGLIGVSAGLAQQQRYSIVVPLSPFHPASGATPFMSAMAVSGPVTESVVHELGWSLADWPSASRPTHSAQLGSKRLVSPARSNRDADLLFLGDRKHHAETTY